MASSEYKLAVVNGTSLTLSLNGPAGPAGPTGPAGGVTSVAGRTGAITLVSADITNATETSTPDTIVRRDGNGDFFGEACGFSTITVAPDVYGATFAEAFSPNKLTADRAYFLSDASGNIPIVPAYANLTAANAALPADEFYWDTTDKKLRKTTA